MDIATRLRDATESHRAGRLDEAETMLRSVLEHEPGHARALFQLGVIALARRKPADAELLLRRAAVGARNAVASMAFADALEQLGRTEEAEAALREAVGIDAGLAEAWARLAALAAARGAPEEAVFALAVATRLKPGEARLWSNLAAVQLTAERPDEAEVAARRALALEPGHALAWTNLGRALGAKGDEAAAASALREALARDPNQAEGHYWLAVWLARRGEWTEALGHYRRAAAAFPSWAEPRVGAGNALAKLGRRVEAVQDFAEAARIEPKRAAAIESQRLFLMQYGDEFSPAQVSEAHREWARRFAPPQPMTAAKARAPGAKIRIGYVSPRFQVSSMAFALLPVLQHHDRNRFEVYCYAEREAIDATGERFRALADGWRETQGLSDDAVAKAIAADAIDVLVDLAGHTPGNRLQVFARRPAAVAVSWLDYFNTTGVEAVDALVADDTSLATPLAQAFAETPVSAGPVRYPYEAPAYAPPVVPPRAGGVVFGSFARLAKITERALDAWSAVLERVEGSRLLLKNDTVGDPMARIALHEAFKRRGVDLSRVELRAESGHERMLSELSEVDIVLDTFPYNGGITTLEALWMGRPVVTLRGDTLVGRQGASILTAAGLQDLVAQDPDAYVRIAAELACDPARRAELAKTLRDRILASPLGDAQNFTRRLESLFERLLAERIPS